MDYESIREQLCKGLCAEVSLSHTEHGLRLLTPFTFPDGDAYSMYLSPLPSGGLRLSDKGSTLMHLSYEQDIGKLQEDGTRRRIFEQVLAEMGLSDDEGELFLEAPAGNLADSVFRFGQALTRVHDLTFLSRVQVESTFYDDLQESLTQIVGVDRLARDFTSTGVPEADNYPADFAVVGSATPLLIFGVPNKTKATLAALVITYLRKNSFRFKSLAVYSDMATIPRVDVSRLTNAADAQIASIADREALTRKVLEAID
ncbi:hypothetical protein BH09PSE5_BH09PSE5_02320 [soil metagenome]